MPLCMYLCFSGLRWRAHASKHVAHPTSALPPAYPTAFQIEMFKKRFGYSDATVTAELLKKASSDAGALAGLTGRVGGKAPAVGDAFVLKAPISYLK